jgi:hypothetical protein
MQKRNIFYAFFLKLSHDANQNKCIIYFLSFSFNHLSNTCKKKYNTHTLIFFIKFTHTPYSHTFTQLSQFNYNHNTLKINKKKLKMDI